VRRHRSQLLLPCWAQYVCGAGTSSGQRGSPHSLYRSGLFITSLCRTARPDLAFGDDAVVGLTLDELVARTGCDRRVLSHVLADEVDHGRVLVDEGGRFRVRAGSLPPQVVRALRALARPDTAVLANGGIVLGGTTRRRSA